MSFNNWYKQDLDNVPVKIYDKYGNIKKNDDGTDKEKKITTDKDAIDYYKTGGKVKTEFINLLNSRSPNDEPFQNGLSSFVKLIQEFNNPIFQFSSNLFYQNPAQQTIKLNSLVYISPTQKEFYYSSGDEDRLYEETLTLIYRIRCSLIHGDFDIEDRFFIGLVENTYKILYPIMDKVFQNSFNQSFTCKNNKGTDAQGILNLEDDIFIVKKGSRICKIITSSYKDKENRKEQLEHYSQDMETFYLLTEDISFPSPSSASSFCLGYPSNGRNDWKNAKGKSINDLNII